MAIHESNIKVNVVMPRTLRTGVDNLTEKTGATMAEITRRALTAYLKDQGVLPAAAAIDCKSEV